MRARIGVVLLALAAAGGLSAGMPAHAAELYGVTFPEGRTVALEFRAMAGAPAGRVEAEVTQREGQARIQVNYEGLKPAILYAGDVTCYVLWAVTRDGEAENLGEFLVDEPKGKLEFATGKKSFALVVTAEPFYLVSRPSELVTYMNRPAESKRVSSFPFVFDAFAPAPQRAMTSIVNISWDAKIALPLLQARKAFELATRNEAKTHVPQIYKEAGEALASANQLQERSPQSRKLLDNARRAVALSNEAINIALRRLEGIAVEREVQQRKLEMKSLEERAAAAEAAAGDAEAMVAASRRDMDRLREETAGLERQKTTLQSEMAGLRDEKQRLLEEKGELNVRLSDALSHVANTRNSARGFVVNLPDILFDINQATLKSDAKTVLAKLAGILLVIPDLRIEVEGHTDSTGSEEYNLDLSRRRAESVVEFLTGEGLDATRLTSVGFGMSRPVADNATAAGRSQNRRVEIVISES